MSQSPSGTRPGSPLHLGSDRCPPLAEPESGQTLRAPPALGAWAPGAWTVCARQGRASSGSASGPAGSAPARRSLSHDAKRFTDTRAIEDLSMCAESNRRWRFLGLVARDDESGWGCPQGRGPPPSQTAARGDSAANRQKGKGRLRMEEEMKEKMTGKGEALGSWGRGG